MIRVHASAVGLLLILSGCPGKKGPPQQALPAPPPATAAVTAEAPDETCGAPLTAPSARLTLAGPPSGPLVLGVLGPINEDSDANLTALERYRAFFVDEKAAAIVVTGDVSEEPARIARVLGVLASSGLPILAILGNTESRADFDQGLREVQERFPKVVNLARVRLVQFPQLALLSLPGYHDPLFIKSKASCVYAPAAVDELVQEARRLGTPVGLVSHGPPRGEGPDALDWTRAVNAGDPAITAGIAAAGIRFGFFSNIKEAGGRATIDPAGSGVLQEGTSSPTLFLNPGPADTSPWEMNDRRTSRGMAAVFRLEADRASYKLLRLPPPPAPLKTKTKAPPPAKKR